MGEQVGARIKKSFIGDQRFERQDFSFLMTDKTSVRYGDITHTSMYLENCIYENNPKNVKRLEIGKETSEELSFKDNESKQ